MKLKENDTIVSSEVFIFEAGEPVKKDVLEILKGKKVILFGLPGAFTSVCSARHLPGYVSSHESYKAKGIDNIICVRILYKWAPTHYF